MANFMEYITLLYGVSYVRFYVLLDFLNIFLEKLILLIIKDGRKPGSGLVIFATNSLTKVIWIRS
jgi:hypothetical protein